MVSIQHSSADRNQVETNKALVNGNNLRNITTYIVGVCLFLLFGILNILGSYAAPSDNPKQLSQQQQQQQQDRVKHENLNGLALPIQFDKIDHNTRLAFAQKYCDLSGNVTLFPSHPSDQWQLRAPYFMIPGARKSGTTSLTKYILQHPLVQPARTKELQFFLNKNFRLGFVRNSDRRTKVQLARDTMYQTEYAVSRLQQAPKLISFDATPGYLLHSSVLPKRILCVCPWIKMVVILRNPVDRVYSNYVYNFRKFSNNNKPPFEQVMAADIALLKRSGFLNATTPNDEESAWHTYMTLKGAAIVARSLYEIQLRQWFQAFRELGRDPRTEVLFVRTEDLRRDLKGEMNRVQRFLELPPARIVHEEPAVVGNYTEPMAESTRNFLEKFFRPYNEKLYEFMEKEGFGDDWEATWGNMSQYRV